jgi:hypothetical protein
VDGVSWSIGPTSGLDGSFRRNGHTGNYIIFDPNSALAGLAFPVTPDHYSMKFGPGVACTVILNPEKRKVGSSILPLTTTSDLRRRTFSDRKSATHGAR